MPEKEQDKTIFSLLEVTKSIQKTIAERYKSAYWIKAEMNKLNLYSHSGHCYPELVEKKDGKVIAQMRSILWRDDYKRINANFLKTLHEPLKDGVKILFLAQISFDASYGMSLKIIDIDPSYTLGDLEKEKQETIQKIKSEGLFESNKLKKLALLPKRIAIISVESSKGYADFLKVIDNNSWGYQFFHLLFPSLLQGEKAVDSIIGQLRNIKKISEHFDVVAIIRGGGGDIGLSCYNHYELAKEVATFPIPVITGIGHATNETVVEMISHRNAITPTALAEFLLQCFHNFAVPVQKAEELIKNEANLLLKEKQEKLQHTIKYLLSGANQNLQRHSYQLVNLSRNLAQFAIEEIQEQKQQTTEYQHIISTSNIQTRKHLVQIEVYNERIKTSVKHEFQKQTTSILHLEKSLQLLDPMQVVKRGFSMTLKNGYVVKNWEQITLGDEIETILAEGTLSSTITKIKSNE